MTEAAASVLAVVPARGGSKGIPGKNIAVVGDLSLLARTASVALACPSVSAAILSSDDDAIIAEGRRAGLDVPFRRPAALASDTARSIDMWQHAWRAAEDHYGRIFELSVLLEPTSPLRRVEDVERCIEAALRPENDAAATVSILPAHYSPQKTLTVDAAGHLGFYVADGAAHARRQTIPTYYHRNGACYAARRAAVLERGTIIEERCAAVVIDRPLVNIDEPFELEYAAWLLAREHAQEAM